MRYLSVCSGIESATVAWAPLGWSPVAFAEINRFANAVLAHHYPEVPNWGDVTRHKEWPDAAFDVLVGGTPCQDFSVAGLRQGLGGLPVCRCGRTPKLYVGPGEKMVLLTACARAVCMAQVHQW